MIHLSSVTQRGFLLGAPQNYFSKDAFQIGPRLFLFVMELKGDTDGRNDVPRV